MGSQRKHIVFIDDSRDELATFERLYSGDRFRVTTILVQKPSDTLQSVSESLDGAAPDLFVLDLFFPLADSVSGGLNPEATREARVQITKIINAALDLPCYFSDSNQLLKEAHGVVVESQRLLSRVCEEFHQCPEGGIQVLKELNTRYASVPKIFYSRKATLADAKKAMRESGLDVLLKPHPSVEEQEAPRLMDDFGRYAARERPEWIAQWMEHSRR